MRRIIIYMQTEDWGRYWGKGTEKEGASDGEREMLLLGNSTHRGPPKTGQGNSPLFC